MGSFGIPLKQYRLERGLAGPLPLGGGRLQRLLCGLRRSALPSSISVSGKAESGEGEAPAEPPDRTESAQRKLAEFEELRPPSLQLDGSLALAAVAGAGRGRAGKVSPGHPVTRSAVLRLKLLNATPGPKASGADELPGKIDHLTPQRPRPGPARRRPSRASP